MTIVGDLEKVVGRSEATEVTTLEEPYQNLLAGRSMSSMTKDAQLLDVVSKKAGET